jgi:hypothetical protein
MWLALQTPQVNTSSVDLQRFALKSETIKNLKGLRSNPFKFFIVVRLIENFCKNNKAPHSGALLFLNLAYASQKNVITLL